MKKRLSLLLTAVVWASVGTDAIAHEGDHHHHHHGTLEVPDGQPIPTVDLIVYEDAVRGWNLEIRLSNFEFAPQNVNESSLTTEGHAHLYVNGEKVARLYGNWYHLEHLEPGRHEVTVSLNANGHETLVYNGEEIADTEIVEVGDPQ